MTKQCKLAGLMAGGFLVAATPAYALTIEAVFDPTITGNANATQIENSIRTAINAIDGLYSNSVSLKVDFSYTPSTTTNYLLQTTQYYDQVSYRSYVNALKADSTLNPNNTVLATAIAHLPSGNDANGRQSIILSNGLYQMLGFAPVSVPSLPMISINSNQPFSFSQSTGPNQYSLVGGLEHELNEVLGGGGAGSTLNFQSDQFFSGKYGPLDLYRYSMVGNNPLPSWSASSGVNSYFSIDGGKTKIIGFNQNSNGDFGDLGPACGSSTGIGQNIQNAFNCMGPMEAYTATSPEFAMMNAIGWNPAPVPEPETYAMMLAGLGLLGVAARRRKQTSVA